MISTATRQSAREIEQENTEECAIGAGVHEGRGCDDADRLKTGCRAASCECAGRFRENWIGEPMDIGPPRCWRDSEFPLFNATTAQRQDLTKSRARPDTCDGS